jgi:hypothetical protein
MGGTLNSQNSKILSTPLPFKYKIQNALQNAEAYFSVPDIFAVLGLLLKRKLVARRPLAFKRHVYHDVVKNTSNRCRNTALEYSKRNGDKKNPEQ